MSFRGRIGNFLSPGTLPGLSGADPFCVRKSKSKHMMSMQEVEPIAAAAAEERAERGRDLDIVEYEHGDSRHSPRRSTHHRSQTADFQETKSGEKSISDFTESNIVIYDKLEEPKHPKGPLTDRNPKIPRGFSRDKEPRGASKSREPRVHHNSHHPKSSDPDRCRLHNKNLSAFCFTESSFLCVECLLSRMHDRHRVVEISVALEGRVSEIERQMDYLRNIAPAKDAIAGLEKALEENFQTAIERNKKLFSDLRTVVDEQERLFNVRIRRANKWRLFRGRPETQGLP